MEKTPRQIAKEAAEAIIATPVETVMREGFRINGMVTLATEYLRLIAGPSNGGKANTQAQRQARAANAKKPRGSRKKKSEKPLDAS